MAQSILRPFHPARKADLAAWLGTRAQSVSTGTTTQIVPLRAALICGCALAIGVATWAGDPSAYLQADPALARLLRGMALIKGMLAVGAVAAVYWRLAWPISSLVAATYVISAAAMAGSAALIWQLSYIPPAALLFHLAALCMLMVGWRERS
jgi:hypothetical protein